MQAAIDINTILNSDAIRISTSTREPRSGAGAASTKAAHVQEHVSSLVAVSEPVAHREHVLSEEDRTRLESAHRALREAVAANERFVGEPLQPGPPPVINAEEMRAAQEAIGEAENRLCQLREELLGWTRPSWAPNASLTADWFSDEDSIYDDLPETTVP